VLSATAASNGTAGLERRYGLHGLGLSVCGEPRVLAALHARLALYAPAAAYAPDVRFEFRSGDGHTIERPEGELRAVYDPEHGEVVYAEATGTLYMAFGERIRALCDPASGLTRVSVCDPRAEDLWLLSHPILPLLEMLKRRGLFGIHAAGVSRAGRGLIWPVPAVLARPPWPWRWPGRGLIFWAMTCCFCRLPLTGRGRAPSTTKLT
jgi:hypothetical protein